MIRTGMLLGAFAAATFASSAEAARCPSGQIWRVSKKVCMSKDAAIKAGIFKGGKSASKRRSATKPGKASKSSVASRDARPSSPAAKPVTKPVTRVPAPVRAAAPVGEPVTKPAAIAKPALAPVAVQRPETSPIPLRLVKPISVESRAKMPPAGFVKTGPATATQDLKPVPKDQPAAKVTQPQAPAAPTQKVQLNTLKSKLQQHIDKNRGKLTNRAVPGG